MKSKETFNFRIILIMLLLCAASGVSAADSLSCDVQRRCAFDDGHRLRAVDIVVPAALVGVSALYIENGWMVRQKRAVRYASCRRTGARCMLTTMCSIRPWWLSTAQPCRRARPPLVQGPHHHACHVVCHDGIIVNTMKLAISERRPDVSTRNSFPSGHTATAFMARSFFMKNTSRCRPYSLVGFVVAPLTAYLRVYNDRHWINDVVAGACIGIVSTKLAYRLYPLLFRKSSCRRSTALAALPYYDGRSVGVSMNMTF